MLKRLGLMEKEGAIRFPSEESYPTPPIEYRVSFVDHLIRGLSTPIHDFLRGLLFVYGVQLHQLTPNSILHVAIFITLCECFLGVPPNWALWKRIFCLHRNGSHNATYNIGGVVICVRSDVEYFDVKFPDSVQGWRKRWLYIHEESANSVEHNIIPFDGSTKILRRRSWDAEATEEEKTATEALMLSKDLSVKDLEKLIRRISSLSKKDPIPSSCRVEPYSATNPLPQNHPILASLPPLPEDGEVEEQAVVTEDNQGTSLPESEAAGSRKSAVSSEKVESEASESTQSLPPAVSPRNKRKRLEVVDTGTSKAAEEVAPTEGGTTLNPYEAALISSDEEGDNPTIDVTSRTSTSRTLVVSEAQPDGDETSTPQQGIELIAPAASPRAPSSKRARVEPVEEPTQLSGGFTTSSLNDPLMKEFFRLGTQFFGYRDLSDSLKADLAEANQRATALALKLEQSKKARKEAESSAALVEDLRKRLLNAETSLSDHIAQQIAREKEIISRLSSQSRRFVRRTCQPYELELPENDSLLDTLSLLEIHGDEARQGMEDADSGLAKLFPYFFPKKEEPKTFSDLAKCFNGEEDLGHNLRQEGLKVGVEGTIALVASSQQNVDWAKVGDVPKMETKTWVSLIKAAKPNSKKILAFLGFKPTPAPSSSKPEVK
ncbi:hypothetical protein QYE76_028695 [Lolium multiflorum]|uniref:Transposase (putative) gypsy type domain-containing protein n=1 Tax=Lolium multiflorum TaxID=4521 RepID=A0AAD8QP42_LOLMU|nr:hypothetical protein QYE76_028695 [Lolium multiflorum]